MSTCRHHIPTIFPSTVAKVHAARWYKAVLCTYCATFKVTMHEAKSLYHKRRGMYRDYTLTDTLDVEHRAWHYLMCKGRDMSVTKAKVG